MPPEDAPETDEQREERRERHLALRDAKRNGGHVRSLLLRDEDYVAYDTRVWDMTGDAFVVFWLTYLHGGECFEPFELIPGHNHLWRAVIVRRKGSSTDEDPNLVEPVILVDLDACDALVRIPPEVWRYAFEKRRKQNALDLNPLLQVDFNTTVQVILASARAGFLIKGPMYLLLVLAQSRVSLRDFSLQDADALSTEWAKIWTLQQECEATVAKSRLKPKPSSGAAPEAAPDTTPETAAGSAPLAPPGLDEFAITIEFPKARARELLDLFAEGTHIVIPNYAREMWALVPYTPEGEPLVRSQDESNPDALVDGSRFFEGDPFKWAPLALRDPETGIFASWADTPRIVRCNLLGGKYYLNASRAAWARRPEIKWADMENMRMFPPRRTKIHPVRLGRAGTPYLTRMSLADDIAYTAAAVTFFADFWLDLYARDLQLVEHCDSWYVFRDFERIGDEETGAEGVPGEGEGEEGVEGEKYGAMEGDEKKDVEGKEPARQGHLKKGQVRVVDILVKDLSTASRTQPSYGGLQAYLDLCSQNGNPVRYFTFTPGQECAEWDASTLRSLVQEWIRGTGADPDRIARCVLKIRDEGQLDVNLFLGDLVGNATVSAHFSTTVGDLINAWTYDKEGDTFVPLVENQASFEEAKVILERAIGGTAADKEKCEENPVNLHVALEQLKEQHPDAYEALTTAFQQVAGDGEEEEGVEGEEEKKGKDEEEEDDDDARAVGNEESDWTDGAEVVEEEDYFTLYRDREGFEFYEERDDSTLEEDLWADVDPTPEDLAGVSPVPENQTMRAYWAAHGEYDGDEPEDDGGEDTEDGDEDNEGDGDEDTGEG